MNLAHRWLCNSSAWRTIVEKRLIPWTLDGLDLGTDVLEIGPGPGITTARLRTLVPHLTCLEIDKTYATALSLRFVGDGVRIVCGNGAAMPLSDASFDAVVCFTMLHHVTSTALQDRLLAEAARVLRPGGIFAGVDSTSSRLFRLLHLFDTMVVIDPCTFPARLKAAGFENVEVGLTSHSFRFRAQKPV
ncbi:MAG TPA: class I SAM-dependent methyltransferase [Bryobacteraceae bacterium]|nr:class I SAM-dependent methyltransferase [Bryobacteraceae bacterium]